MSVQHNIAVTYNRASENYAECSLKKTIELNIYECLRMMKWEVVMANLTCSPYSGMRLEDLRRNTKY